MKQIKTESGDILCVEIYEGIKDFTIKSYGFAGTWLEEIQNERLNSWKVFLCKGSNQMYRILGKLSELTNKDCEEFVENRYRNGLYPDYTVEEADELMIYNIKSAKESFFSLLQSEGIDTTKERLIIKIN